MKTTNSLLLGIIVCCLISCKTIKVNEDNLAWKSFDNSELDQTVDLSQYASPNTRTQQDPDKIVIFCASGGGSRAAAFNIGIMLELEKILYEPKKEKLGEFRNVLNEIDYFSTVSGGGWGSSSFIAYQYQKQKYSTNAYKEAIKKYNDSLPSDDKEKKQIEDFPTFNSYEKYLANRADFRYYRHQIPLVFALWFGAKKSDMYMTNRLNAGYLGGSYRADVEEKTFTHLTGFKGEFSTDSVQEITLGDLFKAKRGTATLPMQIANTTNIDNYKLIPFTPDRLQYWGVNNYRHYLTGTESVPQTNNIADYKDIPLASGTKASSGIPFAVTASSFKARKLNSANNKNVDYYLHIQDGGIIDQQAMHSAKAILNYHSDIKDSTKRIVIIMDASSTGIENKQKFKKRRAGRFYNLWRVVAPFSTPDAQYPLTRERIKLFEKEYHCTVIYLGAEVLLDKSLNGNQTSADVLPSAKKKVENYFYSKYDGVKGSTDGFLKFDMRQRKLLFAYISTISTWFASKGSKMKGKIIEQNPKGTAKIMFLAGRGVVQLKRNDIIEKLNK
jgi:hypothetical protein